jgi:hypothetical protein
MSSVIGLPRGWTVVANPSLARRTINGHRHHPGCYGAVEGAQPGQWLQSSYTTSRDVTRTPMLAPAYDLLSTIPYIKDDSAALNYARTRKMVELSIDELRYMAAKARIPEKLVVSTARETVDRFRSVWEAEKAHLPLANAVITAVEELFGTVAIVQGK